MTIKILKFTLLLAAVLLTLSCVRTVYRTAPPPPPEPIVDLDITIFYDTLSPYGEWIYIDAYGWTWSPRTVPVGWRPYSHGKWVYTDHGLMWISKWAWGWGPFHYGRWAYDSYYGWIWIPGKKWAPAWVAWKHGRGHIGWAPLPPQVGWSVGVGLDFGDIDITVIIQPYYWCFVTESHLLYSSIQGYIIPPARNVTVVKKTKHVTKYVVVEKKIVNKSFSAKGVRKAVGRSVTPLKVMDINSAKVHGRSTKGKGVQMYRPALKEAPPGKTPKKSLPRPKPKRKSPIMERHEKEERNLERYHKKKQAELERIHRKQERKVMKSEEPLLDLRKQQKEERKALKEQVKREKEILKKKHEREKKKSGVKKEDAKKEKAEKKKQKSAKGRHH